MQITPEHIMTLTKLIDSYVQVAHQVSKKFSSKTFSENGIVRGYILLSFIQRAVYNSTVIGQTLSLRKFIGHYDTPLSLIARGGVLDFLLLLSLQVKLVESLEAHDEQAFRILGDHFGNSWKDFPKPIQAHFITVLPEGFFVTDEEGNKTPKFTGRVKMSDIQKMVKQNRKCERYLPAFDVYFYLSKYEHFGAFTLEFKRQKELFETFFFKNLISSCIYIQEGIILSTGSLEQNDFLPSLYEALNGSLKFYDEINSLDGNP